MRELDRNGNWKGGLTKFRTADELLDMPQGVRDEVLRRLLASYAVDPVTECWNWTGSVFKKNGRASLNLGRVRHLAARLVYALTVGPPGRSLVMHSCDNGLCVNPKHLSLGTSADNSADMVRKGRQAHGERNGSALLTAEQVREIRAAVPDGKLYGRRKALAAKYGVEPATISEVIRGKTWKLV